MSPRPSGMKAFILIWVGQVFSMVATQMTNFAMGIWAWEQTGEATALAMVNFFAFTPLIIFSPIAGVLVDRWNRKLVMALSDIGAGIVTITMLVLLLTGNLKVWHLYITGAISGIFGAFQWPAYSAAITLMVPKKHYARTSGMISMAGSGVGIIVPILASTGGDSTILGSVQSAGAIGGLAGGMILTAWGGLKEKIYGVLWGWILIGSLGLMLMGLGRSLPFWLSGSFLIF